MSFRLCPAFSSPARLLLAAAVTTLAATNVEASKRPDDVDPLALAAVLLDGGDADRAAALLAPLTAEDVDGPADEKRLCALRGLARLRTGDAQGATADFACARAAHAVAHKAGEEQSAVDATLQGLSAQAHHQLGQCPQALDALQPLLSSTKSPPPLPVPLLLVQVDCLHQDGPAHDDAAAFAALEAGAAAHPRDVAVALAQARLALDLGLVEAATQAALRAQALGLADDDTVALGAALLQRSPSHAARVLDVAVVSASARGRSADARLLALQGRAALAAKTPRTAARAMTEAAAKDPRHAADAVVILDEAGLPRAAWRALPHVDGERERLRARFSLLVRGRRLSEAVALAPRLQRAGALDDDSVRYALAWSLHELGRGACALPLLDGIADPAVFADAATLQQAIMQQTAQQTAQQTVQQQSPNAAAESSCGF